MNRVELTATVQRDLDEIWDDIAASNSDAADRVIERIDTLSRQLARMPEIGTFRKELGEGLRQFPVRPYEYILFYRRIDHGIRLIRVLHGRRDIPTVFCEEPTE